MKPNLIVNIKDVRIPKLTIARDRIEIKIPLNYERDLIDILVKFSDKISDELWSYNMTTLRGRFDTFDSLWLNKISIILKSDNQQYVTKKFVEIY